MNSNTGLRMCVVLFAVAGTILEPSYYYLKTPQRKSDGRSFLCIALKESRPDAVTSPLLLRNPTGKEQWPSCLPLSEVVVDSNNAAGAML